MSHKTVRIEKLAEFYQKILGNNYFSVKVNCDVDPHGTAVQGIMLPARKPFKIPNIDSEAIDLSFEFYIDVTTEETKLDTINTLAKILGYISGKITQDGKDYKVYSFLDFARPMSAPVIDMGNFTQALMLTGNCLITGPSSAIVGNEVKFELSTDYDPIINSYKNTGPIEVLSWQTELLNTPETATMANDVNNKSFNSSQTISYNYTILYVQSKIDTRLLKALKGVEPIDKNDSVSIKEIWPTFEMQKECVIVKLNDTGEAGAFVFMALTLTERMKLFTN